MAPQAGNKVVITVVEEIWKERPTIGIEHGVKKTAKIGRVPIIDVSRGVAGVAGKVNKQKT